MARDYYEILGVSPEAGETEIKKAFRSLAMQYHPDRNQGDKVAEDRFKEINEAYAVLSDPDKRKARDELDPGETRQDEEEQQDHHGDPHAAHGLQRSVRPSSGREPHGDFASSN